MFGVGPGIWNWPAEIASAISPLIVLVLLAIGLPTAMLWPRRARESKMPRELVGADDLEKLFSYQPPTPEMHPKFQAVSAACLAAARVIVEHVPSSADRTLAIQHLVDARARANAAIVLDGQRLIPMDAQPKSTYPGAAIGGEVTSP